MRYSKWLQMGIVMAALGVAGSASAEKTAEGFVKDRQALLLDLVQKSHSTAADKQIEAVFDGMLDYDSLAKQSLDKYWDERSEEERREFQGILKQLVQRAYRKNLDKTVGYQVSFEGASHGDRGHIVKTVARNKQDKREQPIAIDYVVREVDGAWRVQDIVTEGSSLVVNYRRQFSRVIRKNGFDELMRRMQNKLDKG